MIHKREKRKARRERVLYQRLECLSVCLRVPVFQGVLEIDWGALLGAPGGVCWGSPGLVGGVRSGHSGSAYGGVPGKAGGYSN